MPQVDNRLVLGAVIASLFALWCFGVLVREPYPAPFFPRFASIPTDDEIQPVRVRLLAFEADGRRQTMTAAEGFDGAFDSFHLAMLDSLASADSQETGDDPEFVDWAHERARVGLGWECVEALEVIEIVPDGSEPERSVNRFELGDCA